MIISIASSMSSRVTAAPFMSASLSSSFSSISGHQRGRKGCSGGSTYLLMSGASALNVLKESTLSQCHSPSFCCAANQQVVQEMECCLVSFSLQLLQGGRDTLGSRASSPQMGHCPLGLERNQGALGLILILWFHLVQGHCRRLGRLTYE